MNYILKTMRIRHVYVLNTDYTLMQPGIHKSTPKHATIITQRISGESRAGALGAATENIHINQIRNTTCNSKYIIII